MAKNKHLTLHDHFIRHMMTKPPVVEEFFMHNLPQQIKAIVNLNTIEFQPESFIDDNLKLQITDLLYSVQCDNKRGYLYLLVEHQSTPQRITPFRLLKYMMAIMQRHIDQTGQDTLPLVYPMIIYAGRKKYNYSTDFFDLFADDKELAREILFRPYQLIDITKIPDDELGRHVWYGTMAFIMKHIFDKSMNFIFSEVVNKLKIIENAGDNDYIYTTLSYAVQTGKIIDQKEFQQMIRNNLSEKSEETYMTLAEIWKKEGIQIGVELGEQIGEQRGKREAATAIAKNLLQQGMSLEQVALVTGLSASQVKALQN